MRVKIFFHLANIVKNIFSCLNFKKTLFPFTKTNWVTRAYIESEILRLNIPSFLTE